MSRIGVFCSSSGALEQSWLDLAADVGKAVAARGHSLVSGGSRTGMMGALAAGARSGGAHTLGVTTEPLVALEVADDEADELIVVRDMGARKNLMIERSDAFLVLPGGLGTLDELFEVWTTAALGLHRKPVVLLDPDGFFDGLMTWLARLAGTVFVRRPALDKVVVARSIEAALDEVEAKQSQGVIGGGAG